MGLGQDSPLRHNKPRFPQDAFGLNLFPFEISEGFIPERIPALALELELSFSGDKNEPLVLALGAGVKQFLLNSSAKVHRRIAPKSVISKQ